MQRLYQPLLETTFLLYLLNDRCQHSLLKESFDIFQSLDFPKLMPKHASSFVICLPTVRTTNLSLDFQPTDPVLWDCNSECNLIRHIKMADRALDPVKTYLTAPKVESPLPNSTEAK